MVVTVNDPALVPVPWGLVTETGPLVAPVGTVALSELSEVTENVAAVPLNATAVAPVKPEPLTTTVVPVEPLVGANEPTSGADGAAAGPKAARLLGVAPGVPRPVGPS